MRFLKFRFLYKKLSFLFIFYFIFSSDCILFSAEKIEFDGRVAILFSKSDFKDIYNYAPMYQAEVSLLFSESYMFWMNLSYYKNNGHSIPLRDKTNVQLIPLSFGLKYRHLIRENLHFLIGVGPCYTWMRINNDSQYVNQIVKKDGFGAMIKTSLNYSYRRFSFLVFLDYYFQNFSFSTNNLLISRHSADVGGLLFGFGIGTNF